MFNNSYNLIYLLEDLTNKDREVLCDVYLCVIFITLLISLKNIYEKYSH